MKFSTEILGQAVQLLSNDWQAQGLSLDDMDARTLERELQEGLQALGAGLLQRLWEAQEAQLHERGVTCEHPRCQHSPMKRVSRREVQVISLWGPVTYRRGEYVCAEGHRRAALDGQQGLRPGQPTPHLEMLLGLSGAALPFEQGAGWVDAWLQVAISPNTVRRATHTLGKRQQEAEAAWYAQSENQEVQREREKALAERPQRVYASLDGGFVPVRQGQNEEESWREAKVVAWYQEGCPAGSDQRRVQDVALYGTLEGKEDFGKLFWASGYHYGADLAAEQIVIADGAAWIWDLVQTYFPQAVQILDWTHAVEYLHEVHRAWPAGDQEGGEQWLADHKALLWDGEVEVVITDCDWLAAAGGSTAKAAATAAGYFRKHANRMKYAYFREQGYFIGSGTVESGVKRLSSARMKIAGARWNRNGGELVLKARSVLLNHAWSSLPLAA